MAVSDAQRYALAINAGWSPNDAIIATAISIAENQPGEPASVSAPNKNGTRDLGLWQINEGWWARFGGYAALLNPQTNANAAHTIYNLQGWGAWATYNGDQYLAFMPRARAAATSYLGSTDGAQAAATASSTPATVATDGSDQVIASIATLIPKPLLKSIKPEAFDVDDLTYDVVVLGQDKTEHHIPWGQLTWREGNGSICAQLTFTVPDMDVEPSPAAPNGWIGELLAEGTVVYLNAGPVGAMTCQFQGRIFAHSRGLDVNSPIQVTAYDMLYSLLQSKDDVVYDVGVTLRQLVTDMASKWNLPLGQLDGSDTPLGSIVQRGAKLGDILTKAIQQTQGRGDGVYLIRANPNTSAIDVIRPGNQQMLALKVGQSVLGGTEQVSVEAMVTRIRVYRVPAASSVTLDANNHFVTSGGSQQPAVLVKVQDGHTALGILQDVVYARRPKNGQTNETTDAEALQVALAKLNGPKGQPSRTVNLTAPLVGIGDGAGWHWPRYGQYVYLEAGSVKGFMFVNGITVDVLARQMQLQLNADYAAGWTDGISIDWSQPDESSPVVAGTNVGATPSGNAATGGADPSTSTGAKSAYNPSTPVLLQTQSWTCSATSMAWMLTSLGRPTSEAQAVLELGLDSGDGRGRISKAAGLKDGTGAGMAATLREQGFSGQSGPVTYDQVLSMAGRIPVSIGSQKLYHWTAVRGSSGDTLQLANPAPNWQGIGQQMTRATFNAYAPWYAVWINLTEGSNSAPSPPVGGGPF